MTIPTFHQVPSKTPVERVYEFNRKLTGTAKKGVSNMHTENMEGLLQNFSLLMAGDYPEDQKTVEIPVDVVRNMALFASVCLSRLVWERLKLEKILGRSVVKEASPLPTKEDLIAIRTPNENS